MPDKPGNSAKVETYVQIKYVDWAVALPAVDALCQAAAAATWTAALGAAGPFEASIVLADDEFVRGLNRDFRHQDKPTNVLSFPADTAEPALPGDIPSLGDIIIAFETTKAEAPENFADHLSHLVVHGCLHVLGYDHEEEAAAVEMEGLESKILGDLGIADPYGEGANNS